MTVRAVRERKRLSRWLELIAAALLVATAAVAAFTGTAMAVGPAPGSQVPNSAVCNTAATGSCANAPFASGQVIEVTIPANSVIPGGQNVKIVECAAAVVTATTDGAALPMCDGLTIQGDTILTNADGSFAYGNYTIYALPDSTSLGEPAGNQPQCDGSHSCVLYIGDDQTHPFSSHHFWSQTWYASPVAGDSGTPPGDGSAPSVSGTSATNSTIAASPTTATADGTDASDVTVTLLSSDATPLPETGKTVTLSQGSGHSTVTPSSAVTDSSGKVTFSVKDATPETVTYTASDTTDSVVLSHTATVAFAPPVVSASHCSIAASPTQVTADGVTSTTITVTLRDQAATPGPVAGKTVALSQGSGHSTVTTVSAVTDSSGQATFKATDSTTEVVTYTATDATDTIPLTGQSATVTFGTQTVSDSASSVTAARSPAPIGSIGTSVTVTLETSGHTPVSGKTVTLAAAAGSGVTITPNSALTDGQGQASFNVADSAPGTVVFSATDTTDSNLAITQAASVDFQTPAPSASASTVVPPSATEPANGSTAGVITVTILDQFSAPQPGKTVTAAVADNSDNATVISPSGGGQTPGVTDSHGQVVFEVRDTTAETVTFTATDATDGFTLPATASVTFTAGAVDPGQSSIAASPSQVPNDGTTASTVTVTVNDHFGNAVAGKTISLAASGGNSTIKPVSPTTDSSGHATFEVTDGTAEVVTYTATDTTDQNVPLNQSVAVTFGNPSPPPPAVADSVILASGTSAPADGKTAITVTVILYDANGSPVKGKNVSLNPSGGSSVITTVTGTTDDSGKATFTVTDRTPETVSYTATDSTDNLPITGQSVSVNFTPASDSSGSSSTGGSSAGSSGGGTSGGSSSAADTSASGGGTGSGASTASDSSSSGNSTSPGASLAFTGQPPYLHWLLATGSLLLAVGIVGRRRLVRARVVAGP